VREGKGREGKGCVWAGVSVSVSVCEREAGGGCCKTGRWENALLDDHGVYLP